MEEGKSFSKPEWPLTGLCQLLLGLESRQGQETAKTQVLVQLPRSEGKVVPALQTQQGSGFLEKAGRQVTRLAEPQEVQERMGVLMVGTERINSIFRKKFAVTVVSQSTPPLLVGARALGEQEVAGP